MNRSGDLEDRVPKSLGPGFRIDAAFVKEAAARWPVECRVPAESRALGRGSAGIRGELSALALRDV
jgi:hypothetical protein